MLALGADEAVDRTAVPFEGAIAPVDLVFDTVDGDVLVRSAAVLREGGRLVSVAEEAPAAVSEKVEATYFVVEPNREQLLEPAPPPASDPPTACRAPSPQAGRWPHPAATPRGSPAR